jgi:hypothetical protein
MRPLLCTVALVATVTGCAHPTCYTQRHVAFESVEQSMHLPRGTGVTAELDTSDDIKQSRPGEFSNVPAGCYWLIETRQSTPFGERRGIYLHNAENGRELEGGSTLIKIDIGPSGGATSKRR